jgi:Stress responsive A/B Barrel Domain
MSIKHVVMWKLSGVTPEEKSSQAQEIKTVLEGLNGVVPSLRSLTVFQNALFDGKNHDLILESVFDDEQGLADYAVHPAHSAAGEIVMKYATDRIAVDYSF